jgi:hypothetical protein
MLHQIALLLTREVQTELSVVVVHHCEKRGETPIMIKPACLVRPQFLQPRGAELLVGPD